MENHKALHHSIKEVPDYSICLLITFKNITRVEVYEILFSLEWRTVDFGMLKKIRIY